MFVKNIVQKGFFFGIIFKFNRKKSFQSSNIIITICLKVSHSLLITIRAGLSYLYQTGNGRCHYVNNSFHIIFLFLINILKYVYFPLTDRSLSSSPLRNLIISNCLGLYLLRKVIGTPTTPL